MSEYQNVQELYGRDGRGSGPRYTGQAMYSSSGAPGSPQPQQHTRKAGLPSFKPVVYANPDADEEEETAPKQRPTFIRAVDPAFNAPQSHSEVIYRPKEVYNTSHHQPSSPGPPPYSAVITQPQSPTSLQQSKAARSLQYTVTPNVPEPQYYKESGGSFPHYRGYTAQVTVEASPTGESASRPVHSQGQASLQRNQRAPSPYQDRHDYDTIVPSYSTVGEKLPEGVSSRIVYTTKAPPQGQGYVQSRPLNRTDSPPKSYVPASKQVASNVSEPRQPSSPTRASPGPVYGGSAMGKPSSPTTHNPRPYQLKPTLDSLKDDLDSGAPRGAGSGSLYPKEAEVDVLTDLLMKNMRAAGDPDFFGQCYYCLEGIFGQSNGCGVFGKTYHNWCFRCSCCGMCAKCGQSIMGENTGCTALDQLFHIGCFTCVSCDACLRGQPFYAMEGKPYCEACYMNTLEKCSVCSKPITDRVLRATGKPYHPSCFTCVVCGKSLDGIPFTVDATSQIHCIEDFHRKFAPRCCVCNHPIMPNNGKENLRIVALDRSFHVNCYKCEDCGVLLSSNTDDGGGCYPLDDHILCRLCNAKRINALTTKMTTEL